jgi:Flp pilus assembly protein protease CpaA
MRSQTITGLIIAGLGLLATHFGVPFMEGELDQFMATLGKFAEIGGLLWAYLGRMRQGDVKLLGGYKSDKAPCGCSYGASSSK